MPSSNTTSAFTTWVRFWTPRPAPTADQFVPSNCAMLEKGTPLSSLKRPAANRRIPLPASSAASTKIKPLLDVANVGKDVPFHRRMTLNPPPYNCFPEPESNEARVANEMGGDPTWSQSDPVQRAT